MREKEKYEIIKKWDEERLDEIFEDINKEYKIYDSHNPKI